MEADKRGLLAVYYLKLTTGLRHTFVMLSLKKRGGWQGTLQCPGALQCGISLSNAPTPGGHEKRRG